MSEMIERVAKTVHEGHAFYCAFIGKMPPSYKLADPTYHDEMEVWAKDSEAAREWLVAWFASKYPSDTLVSCTCERVK